MASKIEELQLALTVLTSIDAQLKSVADSAAKVLEGKELPKTIKAIQDYEKSLDNLKKTNEELTNQDKEKRKLTEQLTKAQSDEAVEIAKLRVEIQEKNKLNKEEAKISLGLTNEYQKQSKRLVDMKKQYKDLAIQNKANTKEGQLLLKNIQELDKKFKDVDASVGDHQRNVGNYTGAINTLVPSLGAMNNTLTQIKGGVMTLGQGFKGLITTQNAAGKSSISLGRAMLTIPIFALVAAFTALIGIFSSTQAGADQLERAFMPIKVFFELLLGALQRLVMDGFERLKKALADPKQALIDLGNAIKENVINRFKALGVFIEAISLAFSGEWSAAAKKAKDATLQLAKVVKNATDKLSELGEEALKMVRDAKRLANEIINLKIAFREMEIATTVPLAKMRLEFQKMREIAADTNKSERERLTALKSAIQIQDDIAAQERELLQLRVDRLKIENSLADTPDEIKLEYQKALAEIIAFDEAATKAKVRLTGQISTIERQEQEKRHKLFITNEKRRIELMSEGIDKALALEKLRYDEELRQAKENGEDLQLVEEIHEQKIAEIRKKYALQAEKSNRKLNTTAGNEALARAKKEDDDRKKAAQQKIKEEKQLVDEIIKLNQQANQEKLRLLDAEVAARQSSFDAIAKAGTRNAEFERRQLAEAQQKRLEEQQKIARKEEALKLIQSYYTFLEQRAKENPDTASGQAFADVSKAVAISKAVETLAGFETGGYTGDVGTKEVAGVVHGKEFVLDAPTTQKLGLQGKDMSDFNRMIMSGNLFKNEPLKPIQDDRLLSAVEETNQILKRIPHTTFDFDRYGNIIQNIDKGTLRQTIVNERKSKRLSK
jgi:hypothetical protein